SADDRCAEGDNVVTESFHVILAAQVTGLVMQETVSGTLAVQRDEAQADQIRVAAMTELTCGSLSMLQRRRSRLLTRSALCSLCSRRPNLSSISASVIGFLKCPR